jgi:hypothetical protein
LRGRRRMARMVQANRLDHKQANDGAVQQWFAERHLTTHRSSSRIGYLQQTTTQGSTPIS